MSISGQEADRVLAEADCLYTQAEVEAALGRMAEAINRDIGSRDPLVLCIMTGGLVVAGQLLTRLHFSLELDFVHATRYRGDTSGGSIHWMAEPRTPLDGRTVLLLDDILDEGHTLAAIQDYCRGNGAEAVYTAVLVEKRHTRKNTHARAEYIGLEVEDRYVFGYGMDYKEYLRNAPGIYAVKGM